MNRRFFLGSLVGLLGVSMARPPSDYDYASVDRPDIVRRDGVIPYFNGKACPDVNEASATEGWIKKVNGEIEYGTVQLLKPTPKRRMEFENALKKRDALASRAVL